jgi:hypothetical protein
MANLQWTFDSGEDDPEWLERTDDERAELHAEGLPSDHWTAQWRDLEFIVTEQQFFYEDDSTERAYVLRTTDWADDVAYHSRNRISKLPRLGTAVEFATLADAQQYAQKMCDDMATGFNDDAAR